MNLLLKVLKFLEKINGYISYLKGENPLKFPVKSQF